MTVVAMTKNGTRKRTTVIDDNIDDYTKPQLFFRLATGYAGSSHQLFKSILAGDLPQTFGHAQAAHFLFDHAVELFLKGAILKSTDKIEHTHCLEPLFKRYRKLYPKKEFEFTGRIAETVRHDRTSPHSEFPRYPIDRSGNVWSGYNAYSLETWLKQSEHLRDDLARLIPKIEPLPIPAYSAHRFDTH